LLNCNIGWKKHTLDLALIASLFSQTLLQESFTRKWWLSFKVEIWKFTKNKLLKLVNSMKADFLFAGLNQNRTIQKNRCQNKAHFMDDVFLKNKGHYIFECWELVLVCPPYQNFWLRA